MKNFNFYKKSYLNYLKYYKNLSSASWAAYQSDLSLFQDFLYKKKIIDMAKITNLIIHDYQQACQKTYRDASLRRKLTVIKNFLLFLNQEHSFSFSFAQQIGIKKPEQFFPKLMSIHGIKDFLTNFEKKNNLKWFDEGGDFLKKKKFYRDQLILEGLYVLGARVSELNHLTLDKINWQEGVVTLLGKGNKSRIVPITHAFLDKLKIYVRKIRPLLTVKVGMDSSYLFLNLQGKKISRIGIWKIIKKNFSESGLSPHSFRHMYATHLLRNGLNIRMVQELLGHESIRTTEKYTHLVNKDLIETLERFHPFYKKLED